MNHYQNVFEAEGYTARDMFRELDKLSLRIVMLVKDEKLLGVLSDGDIRRLILNGGDLEATALDVATKNPVTAKCLSEAIRILNEKPNLKAIPIVDDESRLIDIYSNGAPIYSKINIPVIINAGGKGTRLDPYTRVLPKPLIPIGDIPILELIMQEFEKYACNDFSIIINYKGQMIKAYFSDNSNSYDISWIEEKEPLGTGGGLGLMREQISSPFFFTSCDTLIQTDYACVLEQHKRENNIVTIVCAYKNIRIPYGVIDTDKCGSIVSMREKPDISFLTNTGMYVVEPEVVEEINEGEAIGFPDVIERLRKKGKKVGVYPISEIEWLDMGQLSELNRMKEVLLKEKEQ